MKRYRSAREILKEIDAVLSESPSPRNSPLERVLEILKTGRQYQWSGIYVSTPDGLKPATDSCGEESSLAPSLVVPVKIAGRVLGEIRAQGEHASSAQDRFLLKTVAERVARFLTSNGKHLLLSFLRFGTEAQMKSRHTAGGN